ncbi:hypothetical protein BD560DRAFT_492722, partial [Blakeslea trispora]
MPPCAACQRGRRKCIKTKDDKKCQRCERLQKPCLSASFTEEQHVDFLKTEIQKLDITFDQLAKVYANLSHRLVHARTVYELTRHWKIKVMDGQLVIETDIKNMHDLASLYSVSYLSPLSSDKEVRSGLLFKFRSDCKSNWTPFMIKLFTRPFPIPQIPLVPLLRLEDCIDTYFSCHYFFRVLVHERSFRSRLASLQDPLDDLTVLCICCYVCAIPCRHMKHDLTELRNMADACYQKAKGILLDQFDVHEKRLENVVSICLLAHYLHLTLRFSEARRLLDLAYQLCLDLQDHQAYRCQLDDSFPNMETEATEDIDYALSARAIYVIIYFRRLVNFFSSEDAYYEPRLRLPQWKYVPDESDQVKRLVRSQNWIISIFSHPFITRLWKEIHCVRIGRTCKLSFESIFRVEEVMMEWASIVPQEFRLSENFNDYSLCSSAIESATDVFKILMFTDFHMVQISLFSSLLQPTEEYLEIAQFVLHYALEKSLQSCQLLLCAIKRLFAIQSSTPTCMHSIVACDILFFIVRVVHLLTLSLEDHISMQARELMKACYREMHHLPFIQHLHLSTEESPMADVLTLYDKRKPFKVDYYDSYTHPWFTLIYDMT